MTTTLSTGPVRWLPAVSPRRRLSRWWRDASVRKKLLSVVLGSMLVCVPPVVVAIVLQVRLDHARAVAEETRQTIIGIDTLQDTILEAATAMRFFAILSFNDRQYVEDYEQAIAAVPDEIAAIEAGLPPGLEDAMDDVIASNEARLEAMDTLVHYMPTPDMVDNPSDDALVNQRPTNLLEALLAETEAEATADQDLNRLEGLAFQRLHTERADIERMERQLVWATLATLAGALLAATLGALVVTAGIVRRIELLSEHGRRFVDGEGPPPMDPAGDEIGRLTNNMGVLARQLDDRRREAEAATRAKDEFLGHISHELRAPLTAIIGFGQLLEEDEEQSAENLESAQHIISAGHHVLALIDELLDIAKIEAGQLEVASEPVRIAAIATETLALVGSTATARSLELTSDCPPELVVTADRRRLTQVVINLLTNAIKYNRPSGSVRLIAEPHDDLVRIRVIDTGPGIASADLDLLFRPYERLDAKGSTIEGSGIGLALTKRLVEAMAGTIGVESTIGQGTAFWVDLPRTTDDAKGEVTTSPTAADSQRT